MYKFKNLYVGTDIHMTGLNGPVTKISLIKNNGDALCVATPIKGKNIIVIGSNDEISYYQHDNGYMTVIINGHVKTAILIDEDGYGKHGCFINTGGLTLDIETKDILTIKDAMVYQAKSIDNIEDEDVLITIYREYLSMLEKGGYREEYMQKTLENKKKYLKSKIEELS